MVKEIVISVVSAGIALGGNYVLIAKENQVNISNIQRDISEIKTVGKETSDSLVATKLFVAQAHPNRDTSSLSSIEKLQKLDDEEVKILAGHLGEIEFSPGSNSEVKILPVGLQNMAAKYQLTGEDFGYFTSLAYPNIQDGDL